MTAKPCTFEFKSQTDHAPLSVCFHLKRQDGSCWEPDVTGITPVRRHSNLVLGPDLWSYTGPFSGPHPGKRSAYVLNGQVELELKPGQYEAFISRGFETERLRKTFRVHERGGNHFEFLLQPVNAARQEGWISGDIHLHFSRASHKDSAFWRDIFQAHDLAMGNVMVYNHGTAEHETPQFAYGHEGEHHHHSGVISSGEEIRDNNLFGHITTAGISEIIEPVSVGKMIGLRENFPYFADFCDRVHKKGGLVGYAHGGLGGTGNWVIWHSLPIEAALGKLDFLEIIQFNRYLGYPYWYALLNCGIRMPAVAGSDWPWATTLADWYSGVGSDRTYVQVEGEKKDYRAWLDGIRHGRTYASNGPLLELKVNGAIPGEDVRARDSKVDIAASAWAPHPLDRLEVICNGEIVMYADNRGGRQTLCAEGRVKLQKDSWLAVRCHGGVKPETTGGNIPWDMHAHSSPVYVRVDGKGIGDPAEALRMADAVRFIREYARHAGWWKTDAQRAGYMKLCAKAIRFYESIALKNGKRR